MVVFNKRNKFTITYRKKNRFFCCYIFVLMSNLLWNKIRISSRMTTNKEYLLIGHIHIENAHWCQMSSWLRNANVDLSVHINFMAYLLELSLVKIDFELRYNLRPIKSTL